MKNIKKVQNIFHGTAVFLQKRMDFERRNLQVIDYQTFPVGAIQDLMALRGFWPWRWIRAGEGEIPMGFWRLGGLMLALYRAARLRIFFGYANNGA
jgi:hypothetical protein